MSETRVRILTPEQANEEFAGLTPQVFVQDDQPDVYTPYLWVRTNINGDPTAFALLFEDGIY